MNGVRTVAVFGGLALVLAVANVAIVQKERLLADGTTMLVRLAPVDPRSLIQGDYMRLDYDIAQEANWSGGFAGAGDRSFGVGAQRDGHLVVRLDADSVASFVRVHAPGTPLAPAEHLLRFRRRSGRIRIGTDAFYFQEGHAGRYDRARYGELRVDGSGSSVLVGLRDESRQPLR